MRRRLIGLLALALLAAACTAGGGGSDQPAATIDPNANHAPLTLTVWSDFSARELGVDLFERGQRRLDLVAEAGNRLGNIAQVLAHERQRGGRACGKLIQR